jgi:site-specific DNA recombinase
MPVVRIGTLTRRSTDDEHQPYSIEAQDVRLGAFVQSQEGWELTRKYTDDMSGSTIERPGLQRALADARLHRYDILLVYRVDRLARSVRGLAQVLDELDKAGVIFRSATEPFDTGIPAGRMMIQMLGVFAEFERATIIDRVVAGMERKAARGGWNGGPIPFGYRINRETGFLEIEPGEAELVPIIFDRYANKREGSRAIANWLNDRGHRPRRGGLWSFRSVLTILRNRVYVGEIYFRDSWHTAPHPRLVAPELFETTQALLEERGESHARRATNSTEYLLGGLLVCHSCGHRFLGTAAHGRSQRYRYYTCYKRHRYGLKGCASPRVDAGELDRAVLAALATTFENQRVLDDAITEFLARADAARPQHQEELNAVLAEVRRTEAAIDRYLQAFESGTMSEAVCGPRVEAHTEKIRALRMRQEELTAAIEDQQTSPTPAALAEIREMLSEGLDDDAPIPRRKAVLHRLIAEIRIEGPEAIYPTFKLPMEHLRDQTVRPLFRVVGRRGLEPRTSALSARRSAS